MEQLVILIIIGLISLVNWVMQKAAEKREAAELKRIGRREEKREAARNIYTRPVPAPAERRPAERDPFKELMDALGLPSDEIPPTPVMAGEGSFDEEEFSSMEEPPPLPRAPARPKQPDRKTSELAAAFSAFDQKPSPAHRGANLHRLLAGRDAQRQAIILAEILGAPRGFAPAGAFVPRGDI